VKCENVHKKYLSYLSELSGTLCAVICCCGVGG
jgi:hypothetical protein